DEAAVFQAVAGGFEHLVGFACVGAVVGRAIAFWNPVGAVQDPGQHGARVWREKLALTLVGRATGGGEHGALEVALAALVETVEEALVDPIEVEEVDERFAYAWVGEHRTAGVEDETRHAGGESDGHFLADDASVAGGRKIIALGPERRIVLVAQVN